MSERGQGRPMATDNYTAGADDYVSQWGLPRFTAPALCAETDPEAFFPEKGGSVLSAKQLCRRCPAQPECLQWSLDHDEQFGIWGGLSERERRRIRTGKTRTATRREERDAEIHRLAADGLTAEQVAARLAVGVHIVWRVLRDAA